MTAPLVSVIIPVYNEEATLPLLFARLYPALDKLGTSYEIVFINDGSRDRTGQVLAELQPELDRAFPDFHVEFFQGGSEVVAAKVAAEMAGGRTQADVILTSDPFWYAELKQAGKLLPYVPAAASAIPAALKDPDGVYVTNRIPFMVIGYNPEKAAGTPRPKRWADLSTPAFQKKVTLGSPLESGTTFTAVAFLSESPGWTFFETLRRQDAISAGGNSAVIQRLETGERPEIGRAHV